MKGAGYWNGRQILPLLIDNILVYLEKPKDSSDK